MSEKWELDSGSIKVTGTNRDNSLNGSHHLLVEIMKAVSEIDLDDCIMTKFELNAEYIKNTGVEKIERESLGSDEDGVEVSVDTKALNVMQEFKGSRQVKEKQDLIDFLQRYETKREEMWMDYIRMKDFIDKVLWHLCMLYGKKCVAALLGTNPAKLLNGDTVSRHDLNHILEIFDIPYHVRNLDGSFGVFVVEKYEDDDNEEESADAGK